MDKIGGKAEEMEKSPEWVAELVRRVLYQIALRGRREDDYAVVVFTGATAGLTEALSGLETLMLNGLSMKVALSESASQLYGNVIDERLLPWPGTTILEADNWFQEIQKSKGIIVPMLSVNALSKASALMADSLSGNIILQGLFMGKPLIAAIDGAAPGGVGRQAIGLDNGSTGLQKAVAERLIQFSELGGRLTWSSDLGTVGQRILLGGAEVKSTDRNTTPVALSNERRTDSNTVVSQNLSSINDRFARARIVDASMVRKANRDGVAIKAQAGALFTPLARDLAQQYGTTIETY